MPAIKHFAPPPGVKSPPLSFAARTGDLLFISGIPGFDQNGSATDPPTSATFRRRFVINASRAIMTL